MKRVLQLVARSTSVKFIFVCLGIASTIWFLIRVIPKPSRAGYPCMRAAAPVMSAFFLYLLSISSSVLFFRKFREKFLNKEYFSAFGLIALTGGFLFFAGSIFNPEANAIRLVEQKAYTPNDPIGVPKGLSPGRVVWVWGDEATDETCTNSSGNWWFENTNQEAIDTMMLLGIQAYAGTDDIEIAWNDIFRHFNSTHGKGDIGYVAGEKVYVKINITNSCCSVNGTSKHKDFERMDATPEVVLAILKQLVEIVGITQSDIFIGDPFRTFHDTYWDLCHSLYSNVNYCDGEGLNGRYKTVPTSSDILKFSDGNIDWRIPQEYVDADYFINMSCLKSHDSGGITLCAKNHQGSVLQDGAGTQDQSAYDMHYALPDHDDTDGGHYRYRHLVDYLGHKNMGGNTLLNIVDGIWAGKSWEGYIEKWQMLPFDNDYPNSLFISQDPVALESVCWDFLLEEYDSKPSGEQYPYMEGVEDYLFQAADPDNWPAGVSYDPEDDGSVLGSLGVYEHWNNAADMNYTVIDFIKIKIEQDSEQNLLNHNSLRPQQIYSYPNPATDQIHIEYILNQASKVEIEIYNLSGSKIQVIERGMEYTGTQQLIMNVSNFMPGDYIIRIRTKSSRTEDTMLKRFQVI